MTETMFGTDGIRGRVGEGLIRPDKVLQLGWAVGQVMRQHGQKTAIIGKDTRISGYLFESAMESGLIASGVDVLLLGPMPTPAISYLTRTFSADIGVVISASHNPHYDNGIKFFNAQGSKINDVLARKIETTFQNGPFEMVPSQDLGKARRIADAPGRYIEFCKSTYRCERGLSGLKIVLDCAHGATYHIAPSVFRELGAEVVTLGAAPDGLNINQGCGATDTRALRAKVLEAEADLGIAFDGDGDRVIFVDRHGVERDGDDLLYLLATLTSPLPPGVVGTVMTNAGLEAVLAPLGIKVERTPVGDRHIMQRLQEKQWCFGAEPSGHVICMNRLNTGDGIVSALQVLALLQCQQVSLDEALQGFRKFPSVLEGVRLKKAEQKKILEQSAWQAFLREMEAQLNTGRILVRPSGTEPLIRILVEGEDLAQIKRVAKQLQIWIEDRI